MESPGYETHFQLPSHSIAFLSESALCWHNWSLVARPRPLRLVWKRGELGFWSILTVCLWNLQVRHRPSYSVLIWHTRGRLLSEWRTTHSLHRPVPGTFLLLSVSLKTQSSVRTGFTSRHTSVCFSVCVGPDSHDRQNSPGFWGRSESNMVMQKQVIENQIKKEQRKRIKGGIDRGEAQRAEIERFSPVKAVFILRHFLQSNNCFFLFPNFWGRKCFFYKWNSRIVL